jgi:hypothetical protein
MGGLTNIRPGASADPIVIDANPDMDQEFIEGSSTGAGLDLLGHLHTSPPPKMRDCKLLQGSATGAGLGPVFLGYIDLCTPSPSP